MSTQEKGDDNATGEKGKKKSHHSLCQVDGRVTRAGFNQTARVWLRKPDADGPPLLPIQNRCPAITNALQTPLVPGLAFRRPIAPVQATALESRGFRPPRCISSLVTLALLFFLFLFNKKGISN